MGQKTINDLTNIATSTANGDLLHLWQSSQSKKMDVDILAEFILRNSDYAEVVETRTADNDYTAADLEQNHIIFIDVTSVDVTLGLFNGSTRDGAKIKIIVVGSTNQALIELAVSGTINYTLDVGDVLELAWNDTDSIWEIINQNFLDLSYQERTDNYILDSKNRIITLTNNQEITLPDITEQGRTIEIFSKEFSKILQVDAENVISYKNKFYTTKGTNGYLQLKNKQRIKLIYRGIDNRRIDPGIKLANPSSLPPNTSNCCQFSYDGTYLAVGNSTTTPYITIYKRSGDTFTKLADPVSIPGSNVNGLCWAKDDSYLVLTLQSSPYILIYSVNKSTDTFTKITDPATLPTGAARDCDFSFDDNLLAVAHGGSPYVTIYSVDKSTDTFTKLSNPVSLPTGNARGISFSYDGIYLAVAHDTSPYVTIYKIYGNNFEKIANPSTLPPNAGRSCKFSYDGKYLIVGCITTSPYYILYKISGDIFTNFTGLDTNPVDQVNSCNFSFDGKYLIIGNQTTSPYIHIYKITYDSFIKLSNPATLPAGSILANGCSFSFDGRYLAVAHGGSPYITIYKNIETANKVWEAIKLDTLYEQDKEYMFF